VRLLEIRLYEGPNVYRLAPVVKVEVAVGRTRAWHGSRTPGDAALVHLARPVPLRDCPDAVADLVAWTRRLRADHTCYQFLLDRARQYRCEQVLRTMWRPGKCLADELGYLEVNSFYRAFRRWTGLSYSEYKTRHCL
jgi:hypothetical protein